MIAELIARSTSGIIMLILGSKQDVPNTTVVSGVALGTSYQIVGMLEQQVFDMKHETYRQTIQIVGSPTSDEFVSPDEDEDEEPEEPVGG